MPAIAALNTEGVVTSSVIWTFIITLFILGVKWATPNYLRKVKEGSKWSWLANKSVKDQELFAARAAFVPFYVVLAIASICSFFQYYAISAAEAQAQAQREVETILEGTEEAQNATLVQEFVTYLAPRVVPWSLEIALAFALAVNSADLLYASIKNASLTGWNGFALWGHRMGIVGLLSILLLYPFDLSFVVWTLFLYGASHLSDLVLVSLLPWTPLYRSALSHYAFILHGFLFFSSRLIFSIVLVLIFFTGLSLTTPVWVIPTLALTIVYYFRQIQLVLDARVPLLKRVLSEGKRVEDIPEGLYHKTSELAVEFYYLDYVIDNYLIPKTRAQKKKLKGGK